MDVLIETVPQGIMTIKWPNKKHHTFSTYTLAIVHFQLLLVIMLCS